MIPCGPLPLISPWLYRRSVKQLVRRATNGEVEAVRELAEVFCTTSDPGTRDLAHRGLSSLSSVEQIDHLCRIILEWNNTELAALAARREITPSDPAERALYCFCTSGPAKSGKLTTGWNEDLIARGYTEASAKIRASARRAARRDGTGGILACSLAGSTVTRSSGEWEYDEWEIVINGLISEGRWVELWILAPLSPITLAITAMAALKESGWIPDGDDLLLWNEVITALPGCWTYPVPGANTRITIGRLASQVTRLSFSPDGSLLATGTCDGMITVCRTASAGLVREIPAMSGAIRFLMISADNSRLLYGGEDGIIHCQTLQGGPTCWSWKKNSHPSAVSISSDNSSVLIGDDAGFLHILTIEDGREISSISLHPSPVTCLAHAVGGSRVICGHADGTVSLLHPGTDVYPKILSGNTSPVYSLSISQDGREAIVICEQSNPALWDITTGTKIRAFTGYSGHTLCSAVSMENKWFVIGSNDHVLRHWSQMDSRPKTSLPLYNRQITCCSAVPDGSFLATCYHDGTIRIYRMPGTILLREYKGHKKTITSCAITPDGARLATVSWDGTTRLWHIPDGEILRTWDTHNSGIAALAGPAGTQLAAVTGDGITRIYEGSDSTLIRTIDLYTPLIKTAAMSPDGTYLASAGANATLRIWNIRDGSLTATSSHLKTSQRCCAFLPDNSGLITGGWDGICRLFRVPDAGLVRTFSGHTSIVTCCTISRDGSFFVTGSNDTTVRLWKVAETGACAVLSESRVEVGAVALSPDETILATGNAEGIIRLYQLPLGTPAGELTGFSGRVTALVFTLDGCFLAAGYDSGICTIMSLSEKTLIHTIPAHTGAITGIAILPDGRTLVTAGDDGLCRFHSLPFLLFLARASLSAFAEAAREEESTKGEPANGQWAFLRTMLAARFQSEIGICQPMHTAGCYDIEIVG
jgi:WD40 repeat protein